MEIKSKHSGRLDQYKSDSGGTYVGDRYVGAVGGGQDCSSRKAGSIPAHSCLLHS